MLQYNSKKKQKGFLLNSFRLGTPPAEDPNFANVSTLLHGNGVNDATVFTDNGPRPKAYTAFGNARTSNVQAKFDVSSIFLDGVGDYLTTPNHADFDFAAGDFAIEGWFYSRTLRNASSLQFALVAKWGNASVSAGLLSWLIDYYQGNLRGIFHNSTGPSTPVCAGACTLLANTWYHVAFTRAGSNFKIFLDGVVLGTNVSTLSVTATTAPVFLGYKGDGTGTEYWNGYIDDFRITKGAARYTANFTPPTVAHPDL